MDRILMGPEHMVMHQLNMACDPIYRFNHDNPPLSAPREKLKPSITDDGMFGIPSQKSKGFHDVDTIPPPVVQLRVTEPDSSDMMLGFIKESRRRVEAERHEVMVNALSCVGQPITLAKPSATPLREDFYVPTNLFDRVKGSANFAEDPAPYEARAHVPFIPAPDPIYEPPNLAEKIGKYGNYSDDPLPLGNLSHIPFVPTPEPMHIPTNLFDRVKDSANFAEDPAPYEARAHVPFIPVPDPIYEPPNLAEKIGKHGRYAEDPDPSPTPSFGTPMSEIPPHVLRLLDITANIGKMAASITQAPIRPEPPKLIDFYSAKLPDPVPVRLGDIRMVDISSYTSQFLDTDKDTKGISAPGLTMEPKLVFFGNEPKAPEPFVPKLELVTLRLEPDPPLVFKPEPDFEWHPPKPFVPKLESDPPLTFKPEPDFEWRPPKPFVLKPEPEFEWHSPKPFVPKFEPDPPLAFKPEPVFEWHSPRPFVPKLELDPPEVKLTGSGLGPVWKRSSRFDPLDAPVVPAFSAPTSLPLKLDFLDKPIIPKIEPVSALTAGRKRDPVFHLPEPPEIKLPDLSTRSDFSSLTPKRFSVPFGLTDSLSPITTTRSRGESEFGIKGSLKDPFALSLGRVRSDLKIVLTDRY